MRATTRFAMMVFLIAPMPALGAAAPAPPRGFDRFVGEEMAARKIPGLSIGYARDGASWAKGYGYADLENQVPARADASYRLASVTKPMTATAILRLVEQGKVDLDAEVQTYVPYFPRKPYPVTVRQLLGHLGGINAYVNSDAEQHFKEHKDTRQSLAVFQDFALVAEPGTRYRYTSYGYNLLGAVIEGASGQSYGEFMQAALWGPLGMRATRLDDPLALIAQRVRGYQLVDGQLRHAEFVDVSSRFSAGGTRSSVPDMLRFGQGKVLSDASLALMTTSMVTRSGVRTGYGMGWETRALDGKFVVSHDGVQPETSTVLFVFPSRKLSIAVAANLQRVDLGAFARRLFEAVTGEAWELDVYIRDPAYRPYYRTMQGLYNEGRAHVEARRAAPADGLAIDAAFAAINRHEADPGGTQLLLAGSVMAQALAASGITLERYSNAGALAFFHDYVALYRRDGAIPAARRFTPAFEQACAALYPDWSRNRARGGTLAARLKGYGRAQAYPRHVVQLRDAALRALAQGKPDAALQSARLAAGHYGADDAAVTLLGAVAILTGDKAGGARALKVSMDMAPAGSASAAALNALAYQVAAGGGPAAGHAIDLLKGAAALYPRDANLQDSLGEFHAYSGENDQALAAYQQALALDPHYPNAGAARAIVHKLSQAK